MILRFRTCSPWWLIPVATMGSCPLACGEADPNDAPRSPSEPAPVTLLHVDDDAAAGGDGSEAHPFQTIAEAVAAVETGMTIRVAAGHYPEGLHLAGQFEIAGSEQGVVVGEGGDYPAVSIAPNAKITLSRLDVHGVASDHAHVTLAEVTLKSQGARALEALQSDVHVRECSVSGSSGGVRISGGALVVTDSSFHDLGGLGIEAVERAEVDVQKSSFVDIVGVGASATDSALTLSDSRFERITRDPQGGDGVIDGIGVEVHSGTATLRNSVFADIDAQGVWIDASDGAITATHFERIGVTAVVFLGSAPEGDASLDSGTLTHSTFADNGRDVYVRQSSAVVANNTMTRSRQGSILVSTEATVSISDNTMTELGAEAITLLQAGESTISANEVRVAADSCIKVSTSDSRVAVVDNVLESCASSAIYLADVTNVEVRGNAIDKVTLDPMFGVLAEGISATNADVTIEGNEIIAALGLGISVAQTSGTIRGNDLRSCGMGGIMVTDKTTARLAVTDNRVEDNTGVGIIALGAELDITENRFASTTLGSSGFGDGIALVDGTVAKVSGNTCSGNRLNGLVIMENVVATVDANEFSTNGGYGIRIYCASAGVTPSQVDIGENVYSGNENGEVADCK
jgi:hypothetical protein